MERKGEKKKKEGKRRGLPFFFLPCAARDARREKGEKKRKKGGKGKGT